MLLKLMLSDIIRLDIVKIDLLHSCKALARSSIAIHQTDPRDMEDCSLPKAISFYCPNSSNPSRNRTSQPKEINSIKKEAAPPSSPFTPPNPAYPPSPQSPPPPPTLPPTPAQQQTSLPSPPCPRAQQRRAQPHNPKAPSSSRPPPQLYTPSQA